MRDLKMLATLDNTFWKLHEGYYDEWQALSMAQFYKDQIAYAGVKVTMEPQEHLTVYRIYVLTSKGETI